MSKSEWQPYCDGPADRRKLDAKVTVKITNDYSDGYHSEHEAIVDGPDMAVEVEDIYDDAIEQWFNDVVLQETGDASHNSDRLGYCYTATVITAADASLVGREYEWAGY